MQASRRRLAAAEAGVTIEELLEHSYVEAQALSELEGPGEVEVASGANVSARDRSNAEPAG